ncbi:MAG: indoleacetamide hydrolase [Proteobacteria bacterium]|nr:indoleacetamide hydrolase [Pseudomonadota bacterium]
MQRPLKTSRRDVLAWGAALASGLVACNRGEEHANAPVTPDRLTELSAIDGIRAMRQGEVSAEDYAAALLQRCEAGKHLNAFITLDRDRVLEAARESDRRRASGAQPGPLHGLPIPVKDSVNTRDYPTTGGTPALRNFRAAEDANLIRILVDAGAIVMGKTNIHELSFGWTSNNLAFGAVHNPYDISRIPGGSSGGTAAAVAAGMAPLGIGEDTQGSIRVPAALCGICGFRPTTGRYPNDGVMPITPLFDQVGPLARTVSDLMLFDAVITGEAVASEAVSLQGVRLGVAREYYFDSLDFEVERVINETLRKLTDAGAVLVEADVPGLADLIQLTTAQVQLHDVVPRFSEYLDTYDVGITFEQLLAQASIDIQDTFKRYALPGAEFAIQEQDYIAARDVHLPALRQALRDYFHQNDVAAMVFPATMAAATPIGMDVEVEINGNMVSLETVMARNISPGSTAGIPGLVLPAGLTTNGLPVGIELEGPEGSDRSVLALGRAIEQVIGRLPPPDIFGQR